jgi:hypothetical protein
MRWHCADEKISSAGHPYRLVLRVSGLGSFAVVNLGFLRRVEH